MNHIEFLKELNNLRTRLIGKDIESIEPPDAGEAICKFVMADGSAFRLHATDLGFWIEDTVATPENLYPSIENLQRDFEYHTHSISPNYDFEIEEPKITIDDLVLILSVEAMDGRIFKADITKFNKWELLVCNHPKGLKLLSSSLTNFLYWKSAFNDKNDDCPKELYLTE